ncbi:MAG: SpoIIE family protein phosphatase [Verrucomicrobiae bacterium]|nr:SpoIIE family protein phosphatase [Verrucomicrobiae bacterium]
MVGLDFHNTAMISRRQALRLLLIEHDVVVANTVSGMLEQARESGSGIAVATSLAAALDLISREEFAVILLELFMPDGAGPANLTVLQKVTPQTPIIVLGAADDDSVVTEVVRSGAQDYLVKSQLTLSNLRRSIRYAIERHESEMALIAQEEKYHSIFDHLAEGIFQTTPDGQYLLANAALARIYGYATPEELMQSVTDIGRRLYVAPGRREQFQQLMQQRDVIVGFTSQIFRKDGSIIWISENCRAIRGAGGQLLYYEGTVEDITARRQAEDSVKESEALYHSLVETMPQNVFRKDLQGRFTFANQHYCDHYGVPLEAILGKTDFDFFPVELARQYQADDRRVMATGQTLSIVEEHQPLGQNKSYVQVVKTPLYGKDQTVIGVQGIFWDITEQKLAQERLNQARDDLAASEEQLRRKNEQLENDLKTAREIQFAMLPQEYPVLPRGATAKDSAFQFTHRYLPSGTVGGDFFSITPISDQEVAVFLCDVAGHGVRSALITMMIRTLVENLRPLAHDPGRFITELNAELFAILKPSGASILTTAFFMVVHAATGQMRYVNAGHPKPFLLRRSARLAEEIKNQAGAKSQPALGLFEQHAYQSSEIQLQPGDAVMLFTDGLYEIQASDDSLYSRERLLAAAKKYLSLPVHRVVNALLRETKKFAADGHFEDDVCLLALEYRDPAATQRDQPR